MKRTNLSIIISQKDNLILHSFKTVTADSNMFEKNILLVKTLLIGLLLLLILPGGSNIYSQNFQTYPIPSYNAPVDGYADFISRISVSQGYRIQGNRRLNVPEEQRQIHVHLISCNNPGQQCEATVWIYSLDSTTIIGPFQLLCGQTLSENIDDRQWGVLVESDEQIVVDVWIDDGGTQSTQGMIRKSKEIKLEDQL
jgi:hypothetical protein